jgi:small-conductance mechanosensitive channel
MKIFKILSLLFSCVILCCLQSMAQKTTADSSQHATENYLLQQKEQQIVDSLTLLQLQKELAQASKDSKKKKQLEDSLRQIMVKDSIRKVEQQNKIAFLKLHATGYPVILLKDTLFKIYTTISSFTAAERAVAVSERIKKLYDDAFFKPDSLETARDENNVDVVYNGDHTILSVSNLDALWYNQPQDSLAKQYTIVIKNAVIKAKQANSFTSWLMRALYMSLILLGTGLIVFIINKLFRRTAKIIKGKRDKYFKGIAIKNIRLLPANQQYLLALRLNNILRIAVIILLVYLTLPLLFSIFPQTEFFASLLWGWIATPAKAILNGIIAFLPNLFTIAIIYVAFRYLVKFIKYFFDQIEHGGITLNGFHKDWATPTFNIIRFIVYAFMFVVIFPYLPGSGSPAFQGVSVFLGLLISLGSSSAISNIVSGLVITYMRPFKIGDRVKIGEVTGDVIEKTMLVTRIKTIKNEDITVPNSTVINSHTINYSAHINDTGLIIHTTVTIGYDVPWKDMHQALIDAALRTDMILKQPLPFVLQTSLDDFFVSYQVNAYTKEANRQAIVYSNLHQNIQDVCNERGIEIMSPHYSSIRDGNTTTIPQSYLAKDYTPPAFNVNMGGNKTGN